MIKEASEADIEALRKSSKCIYFVETLPTVENPKCGYLSTPGINAYAAVDWFYVLT
jgi:hypothetical protein